MMTVPLEVLIAMTRMQSHEELMDAGALVNFQCLTLGEAMFVSHQWITRHHPDPASFSSSELRLLESEDSGDTISF